MDTGVGKESSESTESGDRKAPFCPHCCPTADAPFFTCGTLYSGFDGGGEVKSSVAMGISSGAFGGVSPIAFLELWYTPDDRGPDVYMADHIGDVFFFSFQVELVVLAGACLWSGKSKIGRRLASSFPPCRWEGDMLCAYPMEASKRAC